MINQSMTKYIAAFLFIMGTVFTLHGQAPYINGINPSQASVGETINISGSNFTGISTVYFGGTRGTNLTVVNDNLLTVEVPYGATFDQIQVLHTTNGAGYSIKKFNLTFAGQSLSDGGDVLANVGDQSTFPTNKTQTQDLCSCDFDNDGLIDVVVSNAGSLDGIMLFKNNSTVGTADFETGVIIESSLSTTNVVCGDIDGDGFPDLVANQLGNEGSLYTYLNDGTGSFDPGEEWLIPSNSDGDFRKPGRLAIADLDLDGKPEIIAAVEDENIVYFFKNSSSSGNINFTATPEALSASDNSGSAGLGGLDIADMNNDGFPEIIASNFTESGFYIFKNNSQSGTFSFETPLFRSTQASIRTLKTGDLNNDGFLDVILTNSDVSSNNIIEISENTTSTGSDISMNTSITLTGIRQSWGLDLGDIDGDGDLDIVVGSEVENGFYAILNLDASTISASNYSVGLVAASNQNNARNIGLVDIDNDGRSDFIYTNRSTSGATGNLGVRLNEICYAPVIQPSGPTILCTGDVVDLVAPVTGFDYIWEKDGVVDAGQTTNTFANISTAGVYTVTISDNSGCQVESAEITITTPSDGYGAPTLNISNNMPCAGVDITLTATPGGTTSDYIWTGPNGFSETTTSPSIDISSVSADHSGDYYVTTTSSSSGCQKSSAIQTVTVTTLPIVAVQNPLADFFCTGFSLDLSATSFTGYTYDWKLDGASLSPAQTNASLLEVTQAGDYTISISDGTCTETSEPLSISAISAPTSSFTAAEEAICEGVPLEFTASSTGFDQLTIINNWDFAGEATTTGNTVQHAFNTTGDRVVTLTAKYDGIADGDCGYTPTTVTIDVRAMPTDIDLIISDNSDIDNFEKCEEADLRIRVDGQFDVYNWIIDGASVGTNAVLDVGEEASVTVELTDSVQCTFTTAPPVNITNYTTGGIDIDVSGGNTLTNDPDLGKVVEVEESTSTISLEVLNATEPAWEPSLFIDDSTATTVEVAVKNLRKIKVYGIDLLGCQESDSVTLRVPGIRADKNFTPNGDGIGDCWNVSNIGGSDCQVVIFDGKGRRIRDISFSPDEGDCVWEGDKSNGSPLPDGVYYYFLSCSDSENESSGSIFMAR